MRPTETQGTSTYAARTASSVMQIVTFRLDSERYAVPIVQVQEVLVYQNIAKSFEMPDDIVGIYNLRGTIIPIVDLKRRLGLRSPDPRERQILVCRVQGSIVGFIVDAVMQVIKIPRQDIRPPPGTVSASAPDYIIGIIPLPDGLTTILNVTADSASATATPSDRKV